MKEIQILNNGDALYDIRRKINENFELVHEKATTEPLVSFGVNEGNETDGVADLLNIDGDTLNFKVGGEYPNLVMTSGDGVTTKIESVNPLHLQNLADGEYKVVVDGSNSNITDAEFYSQLLEPENADFGDVWFNGENATTLTRGAINVKLQPNTNFSPSFFVTNGNTYLAGGQGYRILRSIDGGATWGLITYDSEADNNVLVGGTYHNGAFYLVGTNRRIYKTETSAGWSFESLTTQSVNITKFKKLTNNFFVVLTTQGTFFYSRDMVNWNFYSTLAGKNIIDMVYFNGKYYAFLATGEIYTSTDISNWEIIQTTIAGPACAFIYKDYILVGNQTGGITIYDPINNTTEMRQLHNPGKINHFHLRNDGGLLILGGYNICCVTYDLQEFTQLYETGGTLTYGDDDFIIGSSGFLLKTMVANEWVPYPYIPVGEVVISGGEVTYFTTYPYNTNGLFEATSSTFGLLRTAAEPDELNCHCQEAVLTPANLYNLNNYRTMNTSYEVDQKVGCPYHHNLQLNCIQAGTTSNEGLNTKGLLEPGTTIEDGTVIWEVQELGTAGGGLPMFAHIWSDHLYKDASYLRADTYSWHDGRIYKTGYEILEEQYDNEDSVIEVEDGITYKRTPDGFKIADETQQDAIRSLYETKGIAWIYVIDKANKRFKLPRTKWGFVGLRDKVGNTVEAGLPNITGGLVAGANADVGFSRNGMTGAFTIGESTSQVVIGNPYTTNTGKGVFDASLSNPIYGNSNTVQQPGTQMYLYFYIGAYKRPETELELGKITEVLNDLGDLKDVVLKKNQITNCILEAPNGIATYSGSTITIKSGIKILIPFGKNEDGTLNNIEYTTDERVYTEQTSRTENAVITIAIDNNGRINAYVNYFSQEENPNTPYTCWYKPSENNFYTSDGESNFSLARIVPILFYKSSNLQITNVIPYNTVDLLKRSNKSEISGWGMPSNKYIDLTLGASGTRYTAPANGWAIINKVATGAGQYFAFNQINFSFGVQTRAHSSGDYLQQYIPLKKGDVFEVNYSVAGQLNYFKFIYAEGEI